MIEKIMILKSSPSVMKQGKTYMDCSYSYKLIPEAIEIVRNLNVSGFPAKVKETVLSSGWASEKQIDILFYN